jgi:hypothetical protein
MILEQLPLARQIDMVFREIKEELVHLTSGTVFVQIRNNVIGKFGVAHVIKLLPIHEKRALHQLSPEHPDLFCFLLVW